MHRIPGRCQSLFICQTIIGGTFLLSIRLYFWMSIIIDPLRKKKQKSETRLRPPFVFFFYLIIWRIIIIYYIMGHYWYCYTITLRSLVFFSPCIFCGYKLMKWKKTNYAWSCIIYCLNLVFFFFFRCFHIEPKYTAF